MNSIQLLYTLIIQLIRQIVKPDLSGRLIKLGIYDITYLLSIAKKVQVLIDCLVEMQFFQPRKEEDSEQKEVELAWTLTTIGRLTSRELELEWYWNPPLA